MRIFVIARGIPSKRSPQWGCFEMDQAEALVAAGHEVVILSVDTRFRLFWRRPGISYQTVNGVRTVNGFILPSALVGLLGKQCRKRFEMWQLARVYEKAYKRYGRPDLLYSHYLFITYRAVALKRKFGIPLVGIEHWSEINRPVLTDSVRRMALATYPKVDAIVTVATSLHDAILRHFGYESDIVHNLYGKEFSYLKKETDEHNNINNIIRFVSTGSLIHRKGFDLLIHALSEAKLPPQGWRLYIIGEGEKRKELQNIINEKGMSDNIHLLGQMDKTHVAERLRRSDAFILPSRNENFSVAVLEALACGLPVVASICGGIRECIHASNGLLFPVDDKDALVSALRQMFAHAHDYDRQAIASECKERFGAQTIAKQLISVFEKAVHTTPYQS